MEWKLQDLRFLWILQQFFKIRYCVNRDLRKKAKNVRIHHLKVRKREVNKI